jgi:CheY-like chemotaxis protein
MAAKCLRDGQNPRNNFAFEALIWVTGHIPADPEVFDVANILIVDDDPAVQLTIRLILERAGHHVTVAGDGRKGLALFEASQFDLLFLDIFMPGMDGLETMRHIRALQPAIPIIVISGRSLTPDAYAEPDFLKMATKLGAVASLQKPFRADALLAAVNGSLKSAAVQQPDVGSGGR